MGVMYVLDEPSIGLHQRDNDRLPWRSLACDLGNTVIVVEHDEDAIRLADHIIDIGVGAGVHGGHVIAEAPPIANNADSVTGQYLSGKKKIEVPKYVIKPKPPMMILPKNARFGNSLTKNQAKSRSPKARKTKKKKHTAKPLMVTL